jgi:folate-binding protein YgfZ
MTETAIKPWVEELGAAHVGQYRGVSSPSRFTDPQAEFDALRTGCGVFDLGFRGKLSITGGDRTRWLNGMVTNNIRDLATGRGVYAFLLNPQGRILGDLYAYNRGESITIDTDRAQLEKIVATFDHFIIMDDVEVANLSEQVTALGVSGEKSRQVLNAAGFATKLTEDDLQPLQFTEVSWQGIDCTLVRVEDSPYESYEIWISPSHVKQLWTSLVNAGASPTGYEAMEIQRIVSGTPLYGVDIRERDLPQETEQDRALNFTKGCYVGQEIVERIRSRGAVHRKFTGFLAEGAEAIAPGSKIDVTGKEVGEVTSAASLHLSGASQTLALGYIRREVGMPGNKVLLGDVPGTVVSLPFDQALLKSRKMDSLESAPSTIPVHQQ